MSFLIKTNFVIVFVIIYLSDNGCFSPRKKDIPSTSSTPFLNQLQEPLDPNYVETEIEHCINEINAKFNPNGFPNREVYDHARTAITDLTKYQDLHPHVRAYYNSFFPHLKRGDIKDVDPYCGKKNNPVDVELCIKSIMKEFKRADGEKNLIHAFYRTNDSQIQKTKNEDLIAYFSSIHRKFELLLGATTTRQRFLPMVDFCNNRVKSKIPPNYLDLNEPNQPSKDKEFDYNMYTDQAHS